MEKVYQTSRLPPSAHTDSQINLYPVCLTHPNNRRRRLPSPLLSELAFRKPASAPAAAAVGRLILGVPTCCSGQVEAAQSALTSSRRSGWRWERQERPEGRAEDRRVSFLQQPETGRSVDAAAGFLDTLCC